MIFFYLSNEKCQICTFLGACRSVSCTDMLKIHFKADLNQTCKDGRKHRIPQRYESFCVYYDNFFIYLLKSAKFEPLENWYQTVFPNLNLSNVKVDNNLTSLPIPPQDVIQAEKDDGYMGLYGWKIVIQETKAILERLIEVGNIGLRLNMTTNGTNVNPKFYNILNCYT